MQYKLTPEQIRNRAKEISRTAISNWQAAELDIVKFLEEATGEKIPEPFDEGKVIRGSVWKQTYTDHKLVVLDDFSGRYLTSNGGTSDYRNREGLVTTLKNYSYSYIGQFDFKAAFSAGLPKQ